MADITKISVNGTSYNIKDAGALRNHQDISGKANLSGATFTGDITLPNNKSVIQTQNSDSNYTGAIQWYKGGTSQGSYNPQIGQHNTGGDGTGSICILPYATSTSPWNGTVGLFIKKSYVSIDGTELSKVGHTHSYAASSHNHSAGNITSGTLEVARGGTGKTTGVDAANYFINSLSTGTSNPADADYYVAQYAGGGTTTTTYHRRPVSCLYNYMKGKMDSVYAAKSHTHTGLGSVTLKTWS